MLDQTVPNPLAKNPNFNTHKVFAAIGLILVVVLLVVGGVWAYVQNESKTKEEKDKSVKVTTSSAKPATKSAEKDETADWKTYTNTKYSYSVKYPANWYVEESNSSTSVTSAYIWSYDYTKFPGGRGYSPELDKGKMKIDINIANTNNQTLDQFADEFLSAKTSDNQTKTNTSKERLTIAGLTGYKLEYTIPLGTFANVVVEKDGKFYLLVAGLDYLSNEKSFDLIISTFKFL